MARCVHLSPNLGNVVEDDAFGPDSSLLKMRLNSVVVMRLGDSSREEGGQEAAFTRTDKERGGGGEDSRGIKLSGVFWAEDRRS